jgi:hypothetical protein
MQNQAPTDRQSNTLDSRVAQSLVRLAKRIGGRDAQNLHWLAARVFNFSGVGNTNPAGREFRRNSNI